MEKIIEVKALKKYFGDTKAVDDISFSVEKGELFGFLGINGAGKSTTINMLCTLYPQTMGQVFLCGFELGKENEGIRRKTGVVSQGNGMDEKLTVKENLMIRNGFYERRPRKQRDNLEFVTELLELKELLNRPFEKLSGGQKRKCEIARALMHRPEILFLDEPTTGLDPATRKEVWHCVENLRRESGMTVFLTTHYMEEAAGADHIAIMDKGKILEDDTPYGLKERFAKDKLRVVTALGEEILFLDQTKDAIPLLKEREDRILGFEVMQGTMDDVFLQVTGRKLEVE